MKICPACSREHGDEHETCLDDGVVLVRLDQGSNERAQDLIGKVVDGRYRIERIVGRGGMGTVYACRHVVVGKPFAMKVLRPGIERSEEILQRFIREAQAANAVQSRHICEMTDFGQLTTGAFYVVMELLDGMSLTRALREKRLDRPALKHVFIQIAETLDRAHRANIIHRDLKPDNVVLVHDDGDSCFVKLVDFGIAKMVQSKASSLTETGVILGTPYYMSPEQARGDELDHRSDIYALGVMMYRAFTGRLPFVADTAMGVLTRHLTEKPELPSRLIEIDSALERLILRCLEKKPIDRYQTMSEVADALRTIADAVPMRTEFETFDERSGPVAAPRVGGPDDIPVLHSDPHPTPTRLATPYAKSQRRQPWDAGASGAGPAAGSRAEAASAPVPRSNPPPRPRSNPPPARSNPPQARSNPPQARSNPPQARSNPPQAPLSSSGGPTMPRMPGPLPLPQIPLSQRPHELRPAAASGSPAGAALPSGLAAQHPAGQPWTAGPLPGGAQPMGAHPGQSGQMHAGQMHSGQMHAGQGHAGQGHAGQGHAGQGHAGAQSAHPQVAHSQAAQSGAMPLSPGAAAAAFAAQYPVNTPEHGMPSGRMAAAGGLSSGSHPVPSGVHPVHAHPASVAAVSGPYGGMASIPAMQPPPPLDGVAHPYGEAATNRGLSARISVRPPRSHRVAIIGALVAVIACAVAIVTVIMVMKNSATNPAPASSALETPEPTETASTRSTPTSSTPAHASASQAPSAAASPDASDSAAPSASASGRPKPGVKPGPRPDPGEGGGDAQPDPVDDVRDPFDTKKNIKKKR